MESQPHNPGGGAASPSQLAQKLRRNLTSFRSKWSELNGAMGDLGTYIPIILALTLAKNLDLGTTLIFTGLFNSLTGALYGVPMPVQPMKSIAAAAISSPDFGVPEIMAAGICTSAALLLLGATGLMHLAYNLIPIAVVRGIQLAQGLSFAITAVKYIKTEQNFAKSKSAAAGDRPWLGLDGLILALTSACFILLVNGSGDDDRSEIEIEIHEISTFNRRKRKLLKFIKSIPSAFIIFILGLILAVARGPQAVNHFKLGPSKIKLVKISKRAWKEGFIKGTIPQLPLSILNSVIAVCKLSTDLFPEKKEVSATSVSVTVGLMNLTGSWFGAMPCCHGAGGLAGQYKFGGRSGGCVALLGAAKLGLGVALGGSMVKVLEQFPVGVLGVLLLFAGIELAICARDMSTKSEALVMLVCAAVSLVGSSAALGFLCGMVVHLLLRVRTAGEAKSWSEFWFDRNV
ncbi:molybdate transporter 1 [Salvia miltiorrhiza]|uniref:molybdate transporter 1 n=1 Tax=Salvia miltiorrhiza TaxID=226208 RepID=UPI0025AC2D29|nr:molybdate transporter 1 [Salvia miltiorrhiza]